MAFSPSRRNMRITDKSYGSLTRGFTAISFVRCSIFLSNLKICQTFSSCEKYTVDESVACS